MSFFLFERRDQQDPSNRTLFILHKRIGALKGVLQYEKSALSIEKGAGAYFYELKTPIGTPI